jgi:hypothetical protein
MICDDALITIGAIWILLVLCDDALITIGAIWILLVLCVILAATGHLI